MLFDPQKRRAGAFVFIVGPSGAGKDTLISGARAELARDDRFYFVRRSITRAGGRWEDHESLSLDAFERAEAKGRFILVWDAHGLRYGVPVEAMDQVRQGRIVVCNGSRGAAGAAMKAFGRIKIVLITAPREIRVARLSSRGREQDTRERLDRLETIDFSQLADVTIVNDTRPEVGTSKLLHFLLNEV